jgi:hypothetical protein
MNTESSTGVEMKTVDGSIVRLLAALRGARIHPRLCIVVGCCEYVLIADEQHEWSLV